MTLDEMIRNYAENHGCTLHNARDAVKGVGALIYVGLLAGLEMPLPSVGTFSVKITKPRVARNPHTGERVEVPEGRKVTFKPTSPLKRALRG